MCARAEASRGLCNDGQRDKREYPLSCQYMWSINLNIHTSTNSALKVHTAQYSVRHCSLIETAQHTSNIWCASAHLELSPRSVGDCDDGLLGRGSCHTGWMIEHFALCYESTRPLAALLTHYSKSSTPNALFSTHDGSPSSTPLHHFSINSSTVVGFTSGKARFRSSPIIAHPFAMATLPWL